MGVTGYDAILDPNMDGSSYVIYPRNLNDFTFECVIGDMNFDGAINVVDIVRLVNIIFGEEYSGEELCAGDINGDGILNVLDIVGLVNIILEV